MRIPIVVAWLLFVMAATNEAKAFCLFSCEPTEANAQQVFQSRLRGIIQTPFSVTNFRKTNSATASTPFGTIYEIMFAADVDFPEGFVKKPQGIFNEIMLAADGNMRVSSLRDLGTWNVTKQGQKFWDPHSFSMAGRVAFRKTEKGWEGADGSIY